MIDISRSFNIPGLSHITVFSDSEDELRFYAVPHFPSFAFDNNGFPQISFIVYGSEQGSQLHIKGGMFTATTALCFTELERTNILEYLYQQLNNERSDDNRLEKSSMQIVHPFWSKGSVKLVLLEGIEAEGQPSLVGTNQCTFSLNLDTEQADQLYKAWDNFAPCIEYRLKTTTLLTQSISIQQKKNKQDNDTHSSKSFEFSIIIEEKNPKQVKFIIKKDIELSKESLKHACTIVKL